MNSVSIVVLSSQILRETLEALRVFGRRRHEGLVLWFGEVLEKRALVSQMFVPPQNSVGGDEGVGYFVTRETLFALNRYLHTSGLRLIAQVHSHPSTAFHSSADDRYSIVTTEGGLSLVVPNFAAEPQDLGNWAVYRLRAGRWMMLNVKEAMRLFKIDKQIRTLKPPGASSKA